MDLETLNKSELAAIIKSQTGRRVDPTLSKEELIRIIETGELPPYRFKVEETRRKLQVFIEKNWNFYQTNLPCRGQPNEGKCTVFGCSTGRHVNCYLGLKKELEKDANSNS